MKPTKIQSRFLTRTELEQYASDRMDLHSKKLRPITYIKFTWKKDGLLIEYSREPQLKITAQDVDIDPFED